MKMAHKGSFTAERVGTYTDAVFAVIVTVMVLELKTLVAFKTPAVAFGLICSALVLHLRPDVRGG